MPPRPLTRSVRIDRTLNPQLRNGRHNLLTYPMVFSQKETVLPLAAPSLSQLALVDAWSSSHSSPPPPPSSSVKFTAENDDHERHQRTTLPAMRRWIRESDELCIASLRRSNNMNRINTYIATYKFDDPQWRPLLLPEVHVIPRSTASSAVGNEAETATAVAATTIEEAGEPPASASPSSLGHDVFIDYNKLTTIELISRHVNYALRHLVQKGHAMYLVNFAQHSLLEMRGLVESSYVTCSYGIRGERLRTHIVHSGPVDVREVLVVDPETGRVSYDFSKPHVRRGVVAVSTVEGYGTWFQRKPMLWQRTRRIGALQSQMGCFNYQLSDAASVGRLRDYEVALLDPHVRMIGTDGGAEAVAIVASSQIARNPKLYMGQFEAPIVTAVDAVHQLLHRAALHHELVRPSTAYDSSTGGAVQLRERLSMERMLPVSWITRTPPPYVPLEADLPFRIQLSRPSVVHPGSGPEAVPVIYSTGGSVGSPMVKGVPLSLFEYNIHQGVDHYVFDDAPSARPMKWWNQKSTIPYNGLVYCMRSGLLDHVEPAESLGNPLAPLSKRPAKATPSRSTVRSARRSLKRRGRATQQRQELQGRTTEAEAATPAVETEVEELMADCSTAEMLRTGESELMGYDGASRAAEWGSVEPTAEKAREGGERPPLNEVVPPNSVAQERFRRYGWRGGAPTVASSTDTSATPLPDGDPSAAVLRRQLRARRARRLAASKRRKPESSEGGPDEAKVKSAATELPASSLSSRDDSP